VLPYSKEVENANPGHVRFTAFCKFLPTSLLGVSAGIYQRALVDESGTIINQIATHNTLINGRSAWDALYDTIPTLPMIRSYATVRFRLH
jgi:hypothetical protein